MAIKVYKKNRAARRGSSITDRREVYHGQPHQSLTKAKKKISGRSNGKTTIRHRGGGSKRLQRITDFGQSKQDITAKVERIEYDPNRSARLALLLYEDGERRYVLAWDGINLSDKVITGEKVQEKPGNRMPVSNITPGATVYNVELMPGRGGKLFKAAGTCGTLMDVKDKQALLRLPSGEMRYLPYNVWANYGMVSNSDHRLVKKGSAGRNRRLGKRPQVRGKVMNPIDHPHGGGEGAQPVGLKYPKTKWGKPAIGVKTRKKNKYSDKFIVKRRGKKRRK